MCTPGAWALRPPSQDEEQALPENLIGDGFNIIAQYQRIYKPSNAPAFFFDVLADDGERIGIANLIMEPDKTKVAAVGHLCATLSEKHSDATLLYKVARLLRDYQFEVGYPEVLIVIPTAHIPSVEACILLKPIDTVSTQTEDGKEGRAYTYAPAAAS